MQRFKQFLRRFLLWIGAAALLAGATACGNADPDGYNMPTDVERLFTTAEQMQTSAIPASGYELPDGKYRWTFQSDDGSLNVSANASVSALETPLFMVRATACGFTQAQITGIVQYLFHGQAVTATIEENVQTKAELQVRLEEMKQALADGTYRDYGFTKEEYEEAIRRQESAYADAPTADAGERISTDGTMLTVRDDDQGDYQTLSARTESGDALTVRSAPSDDRSHLPSACRFDRYDAPEYNMLDAISIRPGDALPQAAQGKLTRTYDEAKSLSDGLLASADADVTLLAAYVVGDRQTGLTDGAARDSSHYAYEFQYARSVDGVPVAADAWADDDETGDFPWQYEQIVVTIDDDGIARVFWSEPVTPENDRMECASLLTFPQAREIFEKMVPVVYGSQTTSANPKLDRVKIDIDLDQIQLCLLRVKDPTVESKSGLLVPAWVFYGDIVSQTFWKDGTFDAPFHRQGMNGASGCDFSPGPTIVFAVNAVDGSTIDTSQGY